MERPHILNTQSYLIEKNSSSHNHRNGIWAGKWVARLQCLQKCLWKLRKNQMDPRDVMDSYYSIKIEGRKVEEHNFHLHVPISHPSFPKILSLTFEIQEVCQLDFVWCRENSGGKTKKHPSFSTTQSPPKGPVNLTAWATWMLQWLGRWVGSFVPVGYVASLEIIVTSIVSKKICEQKQSFVFLKDVPKRRKKKCLQKRHGCSQARWCMLNDIDDWCMNFTLATSLPSPHQQRARPCHAETRRPAHPTGFLSLDCQFSGCQEWALWVCRGVKFWHQWGPIHSIFFASFFLVNSKSPSSKFCVVSVYLSLIWKSFILMG